jgi:hypothetical protein
VNDNTLISYFLFKWVLYTIVMEIANLTLKQMEIVHWGHLIVSAGMIAGVTAWLDHVLIRHMSRFSLALIDLFAIALLLYAIQFLFISFSLDTHSSLAVGLVLAIAEWFFHRYGIRWR